MDKTFTKGVSSSSFPFEEMDYPSIQEPIREWIRFLPEDNGDSAFNIMILSQREKSFVSLVL